MIRHTFGKPYDRASFITVDSFSHISDALWRVERIFSTGKTEAEAVQISNPYYPYSFCTIDIDRHAFDTNLKNKYVWHEEYRTSTTKDFLFRNSILVQQYSYEYSQAFRISKRTSSGTV